MTAQIAHFWHSGISSMSAAYAACLTRSRSFGAEGEEEERGGGRRLKNVSPFRPGPNPSRW